MQSHPNQFYYNPLPAGHIRLCILPPAASDGWLYGSVVDVDIADCGIGAKYNALSYTWGDVTRTSHIRLRIGKRVGHLQVTESLVEALHHVRHKEHHLAFWVDQICIDQTNAEEKEGQIRLMKVIYERAGAVFAWSGKAEGDSDLAMDMLSSGEWEQVLMSKAQSVPVVDADGLANDETNLSADAIDRHKASVAIADLMRRPWWKRTWILQEATAQNPVQTLICCGRKQLELSKFFGFLGVVQSQLLRPASELSDGLTNIVQLQYLPLLKSFRIKRRNFPLRPVLELLENARDTQATDSRDKIYALIPFACETLKSNISSLIRYTQLPEEAYVEFALWHIRQSQNLDILGHCSPQQTAFTDVMSGGRMLTAVGTDNPMSSGGTRDTREWYNPSWVPDWRNILPFLSLPKHEVPDDPSSPLLFSASGKTHSPFMIPESGLGTTLKLKVRGLKIAEVGLMQNEEPDEKSIWEPVGSDYKCPLTNLSMREIYIRTVYIDLKGRREENQEIGWRRAEGVHELPWPIGSSNTGDDDLPDVALVRRHTQGRRLYYTKTGTSQGDYGVFGLGPQPMQAGDELWILAGASVPFILRPRSIEYDTNNRTLDSDSGTVETKLYKARQDQVFQVVGETFVLGLMDGRGVEVVELVKESLDLMKEMNDRRAQTDDNATGVDVPVEQLNGIKLAMVDALGRLESRSRHLPDMEQIFRQITLT